MGDEKENLAGRLARTFYTEQPRQLALSLTDGEKQVDTWHRRATVDDYARHLRPESAHGAGGLGIFAGFMPKHGKARTLLTKWAVLDFDHHGPAGLADFLGVLHDHRLAPLVNGGTRGRGAHVWLLLSDPCSVAQAVRVLGFLGGVARELGFPMPELRPSGAEVGVFLPYRGALLDDLGVNPLVDAQTGAVIPLSELDGAPRTARQDFLRLKDKKSPRLFLQQRAPAPPTSWSTSAA